MLNVRRCINDGYYYESSEWWFSPGYCLTLGNGSPCGLHALSAIIWQRNWGLSGQSSLLPFLSVWLIHQFSFPLKTEVLHTHQMTKNNDFEKRWINGVKTDNSSHREVFVPPNLWTVLKRRRRTRRKQVFGEESCIKILIPYVWEANISEEEIKASRLHGNSQRSALNAEMEHYSASCGPAATPFSGLKILARCGWADSFLLSYRRSRRRKIFPRTRIRPKIRPCDWL